MGNRKSFKYACVIVTYNRADLLIEAVKSVLGQSWSCQKIIIINNASTDDTLFQLKKNFDLTDDTFQVETLTENKGGSYGFYRGLEIAAKSGVDWVSVSDDDALFEQNFFEKIGKQTLKDSSILSYTGTVKLMDDSIQLNHRRRVTNEKTLKQVEVAAEEYNKETFYLDTFTFVGAVFKIDLVKKIGLPKKEFFIWYDDTEYALRIREKSRTINVSDAIVLHKTQPNAMTGEYAPNWREYYGVRNEIITDRLHTSSQGILFCYLVYKTSKKLVGFMILRKFRGFRTFEIKTLYHGTVDAIKSKTGKSSLYYPGMNYK